MLQIVLVFFMYISAPLLVKSIRAFRTIPIALLYVFELIVLLDLWTIVSLPFICFDQRFNDAVYVYIIAFFSIYVLLLINFFINRNQLRNFFQININVWKNYKWQLVILFVVVGYQIFRCAFFQTGAYSDSKTYIALVNDILETNRFYLLTDGTGSVVTNIIDVPKKYALATWYPFEAVVSYVLGLHPLIVVNTILPPIIMILSYSVLWLLSSLFFYNQVNKRISFLIAIALFYQFQMDDPSVFFMIWPTWGKNIVMSIMLPMLVYIYYAKEIGKWASKGMAFLVSFAACFASTMGVVIMSMVCVIITLVEIIKKRKIDVHDIVAMIPVFTAVVIYVCLYMIW